MPENQIIPTDCVVTNIKQVKFIDLQNSKISENLQTFLQFFDDNLFDFTPETIQPALHTIIWKTPADIKTLKTITGLKKITQNYINSIYLVGEDWLQLDEHKISKSEGEIQFIVYNKNFYKVIKQNYKPKEILKKLDIPDNSWVWIK